MQHQEQKFIFENGHLASKPLRQFLQVARGAGLRISAAESIDAARSVAIVGWNNKAITKTTLSLLLAKSPEEKSQFDHIFELYFKSQEFLKSTNNEHTEELDKTSNNFNHSDISQHSNELTEALLRDDQATLANLIAQAANDIELENIRLFTQKNLYTRRILERMGIRALEMKISAQSEAQSINESSDFDVLSERIHTLRNSVRDYVERQLLLFGRAQSEQFREELLKSSRISNLNAQDFIRMRQLVRQMAKKLAGRYAKMRKKRLRGQLDVRRTMRRNMAWGGIPFVTHWKQKRIEKPKVMVICDVSGSVAAMSGFLLMFLYALNEALSDIRSFAFSGTMIEVSDILESESVEKAIEKILEVIGFQSSNYGSSFTDFDENWIRFLSPKTTVIILGDARGNNTDPKVEILKNIATRSKQLIWLNPEYESSWGTGDSDMHRYAPYCKQVTVCNTLRHLENAISEIMVHST